MSGNGQTKLQKWTPNSSQQHDADQVTSPALSSRLEEINLVTLPHWAVELELIERHLV